MVASEPDDCQLDIVYDSNLNGYLVVWEHSDALPQQSDSGQLVVVWQDYRNANRGVYGQQILVLGLAIYLPLVFN